MRNFVLKVVLAITTFALGVCANAIINTAAEPMIEPAVKAAMLLDGPPYATCYDYFVVHVSNDRKLYLGVEPMGDLSDLSYLSATLADRLSLREANHVSSEPYELSSPVPQFERIEKAVLITAPDSLRYDELNDLLEAVRGAGASPIGLVPPAQHETVNF